MLGASTQSAALLCAFDVRGIFLLSVLTPEMSAGDLGTGYLAVAPTLTVIPALTKLA